MPDLRSAGPFCPYGPFGRYDQNVLETDIRRLLGRAGPLTFGVIGSSGTEEATTTGAGSGIFVAPRLGLTARHVSRGLFDLEPGGDPGYSPTPRLTKHIVNLFQVLDPFDPQSDHAFWHVDQNWDFVFSDLSLIKVSPDDEMADRMAVEWPRKPFDLQLQPPPVGAIVQAFGYPKHAAHSSGAQIFIDAPATFVEGTVLDVYMPFRDRGFMSFPCYAVEMAHPIDHGFSGGPVFADGMLCGIVSAANDFDSVAYVAALWPLLRDERIVDSLATYQVSARGWEDLRGRIKVREDERGSYLDLEEEPRTA